ncbi:MAG: Ribosomal RNA small subunit methyltransferase B [Chlamydiia bacterium]|nr:Ribosomal RNA small subunit methyltransferase B [Chlamydiia bacterium]
MKAFRKHHLLQILAKYDETALPADLLLRNYFKINKAIGANDRRVISEKIYHLIRNRAILDYHLKKPLTWEKRLDLNLDLSQVVKDKAIPPHIRANLPKALFEALTKSYGEDKALHIAQILNEQAPTTGRINPAKTTRDKVLKRIEGSTPCPQSPYGFYLPGRVNLFALPEFKEGLFEIQDEASQLIADLVDAKPGDHVLDYCAGAGGKSLAFAHKLEGKGQIYIHDIRERVLLEAKKRFKRAGIQNAQTWNDPKRLMDWVLVDAPCSGTGTLRRNPDLKWKFSNQMVEELVQKQREIFDEALKTTKQYIVYATCSILEEENEAQVAYFLEKHGLTLVHPPFKTLPISGGMDGFFGAIFSL